MMKPQAFGDFHVNGGSCALGAAADAVGIAVEGRTDPLIERWPWLKRAWECPVCQYEGALVFIAYHLNDEHMWTWERIADWFEVIEDQQAVASERQPAITISDADVRGTTEQGQPVLSTRA